MEYVESILYKKINPSDFKKMYDIDKPSSGGGQTYIDLAGITDKELIDFLSYAEIEENSNKNNKRYLYTINAYVLGETSNVSKLQFSPRVNRNYRITNQSMKNKHPAWTSENEFPEPNKDENENYISSAEFEGIIDDLIIIILKTSYKKYYAGYINFNSLPETWPREVGLNSILDHKRGVLRVSKYRIPFINNKNNPFNISNQSRIIGGCNTLLYGVPGSGKSFTIKNKYCNDSSRMERVVFHPDYTYSDFIGQILPKVVNRKISYDFAPGPFTRILDKAVNNPDIECYLIIEEINRGNAPAIFGDVFQLLDRDNNGDSEFTISNPDIANFVYDNENVLVSLPSNFHIIATMNTADQNVFTLDTAFQRRWNMIMIENNISGADHANTKILDTNITWRTFCEAINKQILDNDMGMSSTEDKRLGAYFIKESVLNFNTDEDDTSKDEDTRYKASLDNRLFSEKVLKYLWDDAFKFSRDSIFDEKYNNLEELVKKFNSSRGEDRFSVFNSEIFA